METNKISGCVWKVDYMLGDDFKSLCTITSKAMPAFGEKGRYTLEEAIAVVKFIHSYPVSNFRRDPGNARWYEFTKVLNQKIYELYGK